MAQEGVTEGEMVVLDESGGCEEGRDVVDGVVEGRGGEGRGGEGRGGEGQGGEGRGGEGE